jgi:hypothetical protein
LVCYYLLFSNNYNYNVSAHTQREHNSNNDDMVHIRDTNHSYYQCPCCARRLCTMHALIVHAFMCHGLHLICVRDNDGEGLCCFVVYFVVVVVDFTKFSSHMHYARVRLPQCSDTSDVIDKDDVNKKRKYKMKSRRAVSTVYDVDGSDSGDSVEQQQQQRKRPKFENVGVWIGLFCNRDTLLVFLGA